MPVTHAQWRKRIGSVHDAFYEDLVGTADCGAFDGGCLIVAKALQSVIGGDIHVLERPCGMADHAVVLKDGRLWDYDGPAKPATFVKRFNRNERATCSAHRPIREGDLTDAASDDALEGRLAVLFAQALNEEPQDAMRGEASEAHCETHPTETPKQARKAMSYAITINVSHEGQSKAFALPPLERGDAMEVAHALRSGALSDLIERDEANTVRLSCAVLRDGVDGPASAASLYVIGLPADADVTARAVLGIAA